MTRRILIMAACLWLLPAWASAQCAAPRIDALCAALAEELAGNLQVRLDRTQPIVVAPFADLHNLKSTSELGRVLDLRERPAHRFPLRKKGRISAEEVASISAAPAAPAPARSARTAASNSGACRCGP